MIMKEHFWRLCKGVTMKCAIENYSRIKKISLYLKEINDLLKAKIMQVARILIILKESNFKILNEIRFEVYELSCIGIEISS